MRRKLGYPYKNNDIGMVMVNVMCMYWLATKGKILSDNYIIEHCQVNYLLSWAMKYSKYITNFTIIRIIRKYSTFYWLHC